MDYLSKPTFFNHLVAGITTITLIAAVVCPHNIHTVGTTSE